MKSSRNLFILAVLAMVLATVFLYLARQPRSRAAHASRQQAGQSRAAEAHPAIRSQPPALAQSQGGAVTSFQARDALKRQGNSPAGAILVSVLELKSKKPVSGALVSLYNEQGATPLEEAFADPQGNARFDAPGGRYRLEAVQDGYQKGKAAFSHEPGGRDSQQTVFLSAAYYLRGTVRSEQGGILADAEITLNRRGRPALRIRSDDRGRFEVSLPPATYRVEVRKPPYAPEVKPFILVGPRNAPVLDIVLKKP